MNVKLLNSEAAIIFREDNTYELYFPDTEEGSPTPAGVVVATAFCLAMANPELFELVMDNFYRQKQESKSEVLH